MDIEEAGARVVVGTLPTVLGDQTGLTQLLQNLVENAIKFRGERSPVVEVFAERHDHLCQVSVKDNGIGIKPGLHDKIFTAFKRVHVVSEYPGTGLGLATCAKVVERLGGRIWVESEPGEGATFHFTLQAVKSQSSLGGGRSVERSSRRRRKHNIQAHPDRKSVTLSVALSLSCCVGVWTCGRVGDGLRMDDRASQGVSRHIQSSILHLRFFLPYHHTPIRGQRLATSAPISNAVYPMNSNT